VYCVVVYLCFFFMFSFFLLLFYHLVMNKVAHWTPTRNTITFRLFRGSNSSPFPSDLFADIVDLVVFSYVYASEAVRVHGAVL